MYSTWKSKARKLIQSATFQSSGYWVEAIKLRVLVEESAGLPFTSRLKDRLSILVAEHHAKYPPPPIIGGDSSAGSGPGRKKASASIPQPSTHIRLIDIPEASLSDDEGEGFDTNLPSLTYVYPSGLKPTPALDQLWPPTLNFERARSNLPPPPLTRPAPTPSTTNETVVENEAMDETGNGNGNDVEDGNDIENGNDVKPNVEESTTDLPVKSDEEMES